MAAVPPAPEAAEAEAAQEVLAQVLVVLLPLQVQVEI
jgi:hypothetical protein